MMFINRLTKKYIIYTHICTQNNSKILINEYFNT